MKRVGLVACGKSKLPHAAKAEQLYTGTLFRKAMAHARATCDEVYILSAKHGLLHPAEIIEPYEASLSAGVHRLNTAERRAWRMRVRAALEELGEARFVYYCGTAYREGLPDGEVPLRGLPIGRQLQRLTELLKEVNDANCYEAV